MTAERTFVIVGAGMAGAKAAETLRQEGFDGQVILVGEEPERPYERPPLSKGLLLGTTELEKVFIHGPDWYAEHDVDLRTGTQASRIDRDTHTIELADGQRLGYDRLLLTTGASPRRLDLPGAGLDGVLYLRTVSDSHRIGQAVTDTTRVVVVGAGWIGLEVAAAARLRRADVTVVEALELPLQRVLGREVARIFAELHRQRGVQFRFGAQVSQLVGDGRVTGVRLGDGTELPADVVLVGVGVTPNVQLAERAGLTVDNGVVVDASLRTSDPDIFAAGDVANAHHPLIGRHIRVEHWSNALHSGPAAARAMLDQPVTFDRLPYFFTDQYDLGMEYSGHVDPEQYDRVVFRGDPTVHDGKTPEFIVFWVRGARILAGMNVNIWDVADPIRELARAGFTGKAVDLDRLADPTVPFAELLAT